MKKTKHKSKTKRSNVNYPVGDFLIRIKNAAIAGNKEVVMDKSKMVIEVANVLKKEKIIDDVIVNDRDVLVKLAFRSKSPLLMDVKLHSKPGLRLYMSVDDIKKRKSPSFLILTTPKGVLSDKDAIKKNTGGEVIAEIL
jgi:small subunit ribosomal protein S8